MRTIIRDLLGFLCVNEEWDAIVKLETSVSTDHSGDLTPAGRRIAVLDYKLYF